MGRRPKEGECPSSNRNHPQLGIITKNLARVMTGMGRAWGGDVGGRPRNPVSGFCAVTNSTSCAATLLGKHIWCVPYGPPLGPQQRSLPALGNLAPVRRLPSLGQMPESSARCRECPKGTYQAVVGT